MRYASAHARQRRRDHENRDYAERDVDVEDPPPRDVSGEVPANQRARDTRKSKHRAENPLVPAAIARGNHIANNGLRGHYEPATAESLNRAE
jgi:hypothetical protein